MDPKLNVLKKSKNTAKVSPQYDIPRRCFGKSKNTAKASPQYDIPTKLLKQNLDYFAEYFYENINQCKSKSIFPSNLRLADVTPVYNKKSKNSKDNYRPVSILSNISKIY